MNERESWSTFKDVQEYLGVGLGSHAPMGILQMIDLSSYHNEDKEAIAIKPEYAEIALVLTGKIAHIVYPKMYLLSKIIMSFNDMFGNTKRLYMIFSREKR